MPRVILITIDTLRRDALTCYDPGGVGTPKIDELAADSIVFTNAFTPSPWTIPSFVSILTGISSDVHRVNEDIATIPGHYRTLAEYMGEAGYRTAAIGFHPQLVHMGRGFDDYDWLPRRLPFHPETTGGKLLWRLLCEERPTNKVTDTARAWLREHRRDEFFLWIHYLDPHEPYTPPSRFLPDDPLIAERGSRHGDGDLAAIYQGRFARTTKEQRWLKLLYDAEVRFVDHDVGRLLECIKTLGLYENSLIIVANDHGEEFWDHGKWQHGHSLYNELVRAVLIMKLPGGGRRGLVDEAVSSDALLPTILDLCGIDRGEEPLMNRSFATLLSPGSEDFLPRPVFLGGVREFEPRETVVFEGFKYIRGLDSGRVELYDLRVDPEEQHSIAQDNAEAMGAGRLLLMNRERLRSLFQPGSDGMRPGEGLMDEEIERQLRSVGYIQ